MTLYDMLANGLCNSTVWIYVTNKYDQCYMIFEGGCDDARQDSAVWDYLLNDVEVYICGDNSILIYIEVDEVFDTTCDPRIKIDTKFRAETRLVK